MRKATEAKAIVGVRKRRCMIIDMFAYDNHFIIRGSCSRMIIISSSGFMFAYDNDNVASIVVSMSCLRLDRFACTVCEHN